MITLAAAFLRLSSLSGLVAVILASSQYLMGQDQPSVVPGRPSSADPARITAPGFFEMELGISSTNERADTDFLETPFLVKYSLNSHVQLRLGAGGLVQPLSGGASAEFSDLFLGVQTYLLQQSRVGVDFAVRGTVNVLNQQHNTLHPDFNFLVLLGRDLNALHVDANAGFTHFTHRVSFPRNELCWAVALDGPVSEAIGWVTEIRGAHSSAGDPLFGLVAATLEAKPSLVFDAGVEIGLNESAPRYRVLGGLTFLLQ